MAFGIERKTNADPCGMTNKRTGNGVSLELTALKGKSRLAAPYLDMKFVLVLLHDKVRIDYYEQAFTSGEHSSVGALDLGRVKELLAIAAHVVA